MPDHPEKACVNCHFFVATHRTKDGREMVDSPDKETRERVRNKDFSWVSRKRLQRNLQCHLGVWDEGISRPSEGDQERYEQYVCRDREDECFFWEHTEGMSMDAAERLQKREENREKFWERNRWVRWGAYAAIAAVTLDALIRIANFVVSIINNSGGSQ